MKSSSAIGAREEVNSLLDYFARRSGLLLPRGEGMYAFMHLSLQEYFAACFIEPRLTASRFAPKQLKLEPTDEELKIWANRESWRETFILLFEMISQKSVDETEGFLNHLFDSRLEFDISQKEITAAGLLAEIATDPFVYLQAETKLKCIQRCWKWVLSRKVNPNSGGRHFVLFPNLVTRCLLRASNGDIVKSWASGAIRKEDLKTVEVLDLSGCANVTDLSALNWLPKVQALFLNGCTGIKDLAPISKLKKLQVLNVERCDCAAIEPFVGSLKGLKALMISTPIDLSLLSNLSCLNELHLHYVKSETTDLSPLASLAHLKCLCKGWRINAGGVNISDELRRNPSLIKSEAIKDLLKIQK